VRKSKKLAKDLSSLMEKEEKNTVFDFELLPPLT